MYIYLYNTNLVFYYFFKSETMWVAKDFSGEVWVEVRKRLKTIGKLLFICTQKLIIFF